MPTTQPHTLPSADKGMPMTANLETDLAALLNELLVVQDDLLAILSQKRELLLAGDAAGLAALVPQEEQLIASLQDCTARRQQLLDRAGQEGLPTASIRALTDALPRTHRHQFRGQVEQASARARLLRHHSLTNWVVVQRTLIHLSQLLEIIATGGRLKPTYGDGEPVNASGGLVDRAA